MSKPEKDTAALSDAISRLGPHDHLCLIYETREEQFAAVVPFMRLGLARGERCLYIVDDNTAQAVLDALRAGAIDVEAAITSGALTIATKQDAYLKQGYFDPDWMIQFLAQAADDARAAGFTALRATAEMTWALGGDPSTLLSVAGQAPGAERLIEYEAKLNHFFPKHDALAICQYSRARFSPAVILDVIHTHPLVIFGGMVCRNPYYVPPEELLGANGATREVERMLESLREREQVEADLRESEERYRTLAETAEDMIFVIDRADRIQYVNAAAARVFGDQPKNIIGKLRAELFPPATAGHQAPNLQRLFETGQPFISESPNIFPGGEYWLNTQLVPMRNPAGEVTAVMGISRDITERKRAEDALRESETRFRSITEASPDGLIVSRIADGLILYANERLAQMLGIPTSELIGRRTPEFYLHPEDRQTLLEAVSREGWVDNFEVQVRRTDDSLFWALVSARPGMFEGEAALYVGARDITDRKQAEVRLRLQSTALESAANAIVITDPDGNISWVNPAFTRLTGYTLEEALGQNPRLLKSGRHDRVFYQQLWDTIRAGQTWRGEMINRRKDGIQYHEEMGITPVFDPRGQIVHFVAIKQDITGRKQHERELESIAAVSAALRAARARADMLPIILDQVHDLLQAGGVALAMRDPASGETVVELARGEWQAWTGRRLAPGEGVSGQVIAGGQTYVSDDAANDPRTAHPDLIGNLRAAACVPLIAHDHTIGALWVGRERGLASDEVRLLISIADIAANAIHRAALHELTVRRAEQLLSLHEIDVAISSSLDLRLTLRVLASQITSRLQVDAAAVLMLEPYSQRLQFAAASGFRTPGIEHSSLRLGEGLAGRAALERREVFVPDLREVGNQFVRAALVADEGFVAYYGVPLTVKGQVRGMLEIFQRSPLAPDEVWLEFMETLATQATIAIDNATLFDGLQRSNLELQLAYDTTIEGWSRALDLRERETELHSARVAEMTERLARALRMSEAALVHVRRGALLHDIGKMGVPDSILLKPGPLADDEWAVMRRHPQLAHDLLAPIAFLRPALDIPYCHHEKWDGTGYPRGLKGESIPLAARLFAVADVYDALTSDRPYRPALSKEEAIQYIREQSGRHFDPQAVEAFLKVV